MVLPVTLVIFIIWSIPAGLGQNLSKLIEFKVIQGLGSDGFLFVGLAVILPPSARAKLKGAVTSIAFPNYYCDTRTLSFRAFYPLSISM